MKGVVYTTKISPTFTNGKKASLILEIWIEDIGICINEINGAFRSSGPRMAFNHYGTINVSDEFCVSIQEYVAGKEFFEQNNSKIFSALKKRFQQ
jgi:hypothetical protein